MNFEDKGKYITILCQMHQHGRLNEESICFLVGSVSVNLKAKFRIDEHGLWYNERLELETEKRNKFTESRRNNGLFGGRGHKKDEKPIKVNNNNDKASAKHMAKHMENENEDINDNKIVNINESAKFVDLVNSLTGKKFKATSKINIAWKARVKEGYSLEDVTKAITNAMADNFHVENQFKHLTAEFFTRSDKLEKWINTEPKPQNKAIVPNSMTHALKIGDDYYNKRMAEIAEQERLSGNDQ